MLPEALARATPATLYVGSRKALKRMMLIKITGSQAVQVC